MLIHDFCVHLVVFLVSLYPAFCRPRPEKGVKRVQKRESNVSSKESQTCPEKGVKRVQRCL